MANNLENTKKNRTVFRSSFTRTANELEALFDAETRENQAIEIKWEIVQAKFDELKVLDSAVYELLLESATEAELGKELESCDTYIEKFMLLKTKFKKLVEDSTSVASAGHGQGTLSHISSGSMTGMRKFKLPTIQFKQYDGSIKGWLAFWAQFKKIHEDDSIDKHDKIEYLIQATVSGSRARQLVESYPAMGENYEKIINSMQTRFGREDLQIEVFIRELLKLILNNSSSKLKLDLATLYDSIETQLRSLETLGITTDKCAALLYPLIESCLPSELIRAWQRSSNFSGSDQDYSSSSLEIRLKNLMLFLRNEVENEERINLATEGFGLQSDVKVHSTNKRSSNRGFKGSTAMELMNAEVNSCLFCAGSHDSEACFKAQKMNFEQKRNALKKKGACFRCLKVGHQTRKCRGRLRCVLCSSPHVALMCPELPANKGDAKSVDRDLRNETRSHDEQKDQALANQTSMHVFLQTLQLTLKGPCGSQVIRALIDTGSQRTYILKSTAMKLGYEAKGSERIVHCLFGGVTSTHVHNCFDVVISNGRHSCTFEALDQLKICGDVVPVFYGPWIEEAKAFNVEISDTKQAGPIELLIGADVAGRLYTGGRRKLPCGLIAMETHFGWTVMGKMPMDGARYNMATTTLNLFVNNAALCELWELDSLGIKEPCDKKTEEEMALAAKDLFSQTVSVDKDNRYEVRLPWLEDHPPLPTNYRLAQKRLTSAVRKLKNDGLFEEYEQVIVEWKLEGIIEEVHISSNEEQSCCHYLPHRPVVKEGSTTKIRPVFDASAHEKDAPSLNHCLETGLNLIELIPSLLVRFRLHRMGVISDIRKAFLQIGINKRDRDCLRFLWVNPEGQEIVYRHRRVVFGVKSSPFLLGSTLEHHLSRCAEKCGNPEAGYTTETIERLRRSFYVDNCVTSSPDRQSLVKFIAESTNVMAEGQFELRGWEYSQNSRCEGECKPFPVLGLKWCPWEDTLALNPQSFQKALEPDVIVTKRQILSIAQRVFDPIGYTCPAVVKPKLMLQSLWENKLTWDQPVDEVTAKSFRDWISELDYLRQIEIPRWILVGDSRSKNPTIHTFCDASKDAYACVVFLRVVLEEQVSVFLLAAKARIAPLKKSSVKMTIPRLELLAATIGARLYATVIENFEEQQIDSYFWSDSSTVVSWIQRKEEWGTFVWNRVAEIRALTPAEKWHHLPGSYNPADLPSRGCSPKQLFESKWWEGPEWLYDDPKNWPFIKTLANEEEVNLECRKRLVTTLLSVDNSQMWHLNYFSKYHKIVRMVAWIFRFLHNCRYPARRRDGELEVEEQTEAETFIFKLIQSESFSGLSDKRISGLNPLCDEQGLIRLNSRVSNRDDTMDYRFPVVLPAKNHLVNCLTMDMHIRSCHVGTQGLLSLLREKFWILGGRKTVRSVISKCVICRRYNAKPVAVEPPPLPLDRVRNATPFEVTGVDFAGPLYLKNGEKAWICLFTCAVYRAIHLELTTSLSTPTFLQVLRRFVSRRGRPQTIYSDNGKTFVGAENAFSLLDWNAITRETSIQRIRWRFNPPCAPWWGGFWERLIGVLKQLLRKVLCRAKLNYEELLTVLCDCEATVNARPLTYLSENPDDLTALSPSMFLRETGICDLPDCDAIDSASLCRKLTRLQKIRENLRARFRCEYLGQLKLLHEKKANYQVTVGEIVLVANENNKRLEWPIGRVVEILPGADGQVRLVRVETAR